MKSAPNLIGKSSKPTEAEVLRELLRLAQNNIDTQGQTLWAALFQQKSSEGNALHPLLESSWREINLRSLSFLKQSLRGEFPLTVKTVLLSSLRVSTYLSSAFFGALLPQNNLVLHKKNQKQDAIILKNASLFFVELLLEWFTAILDRSLMDTEQIKNEEMKIRVRTRIQETKCLFTDSQLGVAKGSVLRRYGNVAWHRLLKRQPKDLHVPLDGRAFQAMEHFFSVILSNNR